MASNTINQDYRFYCRIRNFEVEIALKTMKSNKALGPDDIPIEAWKCLGSIITTTEEIDADVAHRIKAGWCKWRSAFGIEESKLARASSEGAAQADENKLAVASPDGAAQACPDSLYYFYDQMTKESVTETCPEGDHPAVDGSPKSVMSNGVPETGNEDRLADPEPLKKLEHGHQADQSVDTNVTSSAEPDDSESGKIVKSESKPEQTSKKRGQKPNSLINSTEPSDSSRVDSDKEAERTADRRKSRSKEVRSSPSEELSVEVAVLSENDKENVQVSSPKAIESEPVNVASPSPSGSVPDEGSPKKVGRPKKKDLVEEVPLSANVASKKASAGTSDLEVKTQRHSGKKAPAGSTEEKTLALTDNSESEGGTSDSEAKPLKDCVRKVHAKDEIVDGPSSKKKEDRKRRGRGRGRVRGRGRGKATLVKDLTKSSTEDDDKVLFDVLWHCAVLFMP
ncbi:hypothetical protein HYC85_027428 [Camellia sinensis]|uniref:Uncharacterized protein n=1 Tax=Camellia sinensis TaxID=4442 RepID=A0A7J7G6F3_CAMSI|nr:hypothetical protein HYC85_027428 [Camellia sinensis]